MRAVWLVSFDGEGATGYFTFDTEGAGPQRFYAIDGTERAVPECYTTLDTAPAGVPLDVA